MILADLTLTIVPETVAWILAAVILVMLVLLVWTALEVGRLRGREKHLTGELYRRTCALAALQNQANTMQEQINTFNRRPPVSVRNHQ